MGRTERPWQTGIDELFGPKYNGGVGPSVSRSFLQERADKMPKHVFDRYLKFGLLPEPGGDGRWPADVIPRFDAAVTLGGRARSLERRVLLLHQEGFIPSLTARRSAAESVVLSIRPGARKMTRVRQELDALADRARLGRLPARKPRTYALPLAQGDWRTALSAASDELWQTEWEIAGRYIEMLPSVARAAGLPDFRLPDEERLVLVLVDQLLRYPEIRAQVPLTEPISRVGETRTRPGTGEYRSTDAPHFARWGPAAGKSGT